MLEVLSFSREAIGAVLTRHRATGQLEALSDRHPADMGLDRWAIPAYVRSAWPWPAPPFRPRPRYRPSLRGCG